MDKYYALGRAAEHLVCAQLLIKGYSAFLADKDNRQFDLLVDVQNKLLRVQVKSTSLDSANTYKFTCMSLGSDGKGKYYDKNCYDLMAMVALNEGIVAYIPVTEVGVNFTCRSNLFRGTYTDEVLYSKGKEIYDLLDTGKTVKEISQITGKSEKYIYKLKYVPPKQRIVKYMTDFPFEKAVSEIMPDFVPVQQFIPLFEKEVKVTFDPNVIDTYLNDENIIVENP